VPTIPLAGRSIVPELALEEEEPVEDRLPPPPNPEPPVLLCAQSGKAVKQQRQRVKVLIVIKV